jgi:hypothetical protein
MGLVLNKAPNVFIGGVNTLFSNASNWSQQRVPADSDVAFINSNCTFDINRTLGALIVGTNATASIGSGRTLTVSGTLNVQGHLSASGNPTINLLGEKNVIASFSTGSSTVSYNRQGPQYIAGGRYHNLSIYGTGSKPFAGNVIVQNTFYLDNIDDNPAIRLRCDCGIFDLSVFGTASINGVLEKSRPGNILFAGPFIGGPGVNNRSWGINFTGNPNVEFRNGLNYFTGYGNYDGPFNLGSANINFTTNNQVLRHASPLSNRVVNAFINIDNITLTVTRSNDLYFYNKINGTTGTSKLENKSALNFLSSEYIPMATGIFDYTSSATSTIGYFMSSSITLPYTFYQNLSIGGQANLDTTKSLAGNTIVSGSLRIYQTTNNFRRAVLECGNYNLTVSGSTKVDGALTKNGPGNILFIGRYSQNLNDIDDNRTGYFNFSGNPSVEFRNGIDMGTSYGTLNNPVNSGTGSWTFSTNDQIFNVWAGGGAVPQVINAPITINGNIIVTYGSSSTAANRGTGYTIVGPINGTSAGSTFRIGPTASFTYSGTGSLMTTGILDASSSLNTFTYSTGSQLIKGGTYTNLTLVSGSKTLQGNVSVLNTLVTSSITLVTGSFTLTNP